MPEDVQFEMSQYWVEITVGTEKRRHELAEGLTRVGGPGAHVVVADSLGDELQIWSEPWKVVLVGSKTTPLLNGRAFQEEALAPGDSVQWCGAVLVFGGAPVLIEEHSDDGPRDRAPVSTAPPAGGAFSGDERRAWQRLQAGMLVELGLADRKETKRWQEAVVRGEFNADACARDLLRTTKVEPDDPRLVERAGRLERDLLMIPAQRGLRGTGRKARSAMKGGTAFLLVQALAILAYSLLIVVVLFLMRVRYDYSIDGLLDRGLEIVTP